MPRIFEDFPEQTFETKLVDQIGNEWKVTVRANVLGIGIKIEGHGTKTEDEGEMIFLDAEYNRPFLYVWADVNQEDPTHKIDLVGASEAYREDQEDEDGE